MTDTNGNGLVQLTAKDFKSDQEVRWCPGCGDYAILAAVQSFMPELGLPRERIVGLLQEGGMIVLDDFTPCPTWPPLEGGRVDTLRLEWLSDDRFTSVDVMVAEDTSVVIAVKK